MALSSPLLQQNSSIRNIAYAPNLIVKYVNPIRGNEAVIGLDYSQLPNQLPDIIKARDTGKLVFTDLINLVQGGTGFIARLPVFTQNADGRKQFIGILSSVVDSKGFFTETKLNQLNDVYQLSIVNLTTSNVLYGQSLDQKAQPVSEIINLPYGHWQINAAPREGWSSRANQHSF